MNRDVEILCTYEFECLDMLLCRISRFIASQVKADNSALGECYSKLCCPEGYLRALIPHCRKNEAEFHASLLPAFLHAFNNCCDDFIH